MKFVYLAKWMLTLHIKRLLNKVIYALFEYPIICELEKTGFLLGHDSLIEVDLTPPYLLSSVSIHFAKWTAPSSLVNESR